MLKAILKKLGEREFLFTALSWIIAVLVQFDIIPAVGPIAEAVSLLVAGLATHGYSVSRGAFKGEAEKAKALKDSIPKP